MRLLGLPVRRRAAGGQQRVITSSDLPAGWSRIDATKGGSGFSTLPVVYGCVRLIAHRLAGLPRRVIRESDDQQVPSPDWIEAPNDYQTGADLITGLVWSLLLDGNAFVVPIRTAAGRVAQLVMPHPSQVQVLSHTPLTAGEPAQLTYSLMGQTWTGELLHIRYLCLPSHARGVGPIEAARVVVSSGQASQQFVADQFARSATMNYALVAQSEMDETAKMRLAAQVMAQHHGAQSAYRPLILDNEVEVRPLSITSQQAQFLELSTWTASTIAGQLFGVDPSLLGIQQAGTTLTYTNAVDRAHNLWTDALAPIARLLEGALSTLLPTGQRYDLDERPLLLGGPRDRARVATAMAGINRQSADRVVFSDAEIRGVLGYQP